MISFSTYTQLEMQQKAINACKFVISIGKSISLAAKSIGAKTNRFFTHCLGRISSITLMNFNLLSD